MARMAFQTSVPSPRKAPGSEKNFACGAWRRKRISELSSLQQVFYPSPPDFVMCFFEQTPLNRSLDNSNHAKTEARKKIFRVISRPLPFCNPALATRKARKGDPAGNCLKDSPSFIPGGGKNARFFSRKIFIILD